MSFHPPEKGSWAAKAAQQFETSQMSKTAAAPSHVNVRDALRQQALAFVKKLDTSTLDKSHATCYMFFKNFSGQLEWRRETSGFSVSKENVDALRATAGVKDKKTICAEECLFAHYTKQSFLFSWVWNGPEQKEIPACANCKLMLAVKKVEDLIPYK